MTNDDCPQCGATYPAAYANGWSGGSNIVTTSYHCKHCETRWDVVHDCETHETKVMVR
jgi:transposase-like protein